MSTQEQALVTLTEPAAKKVKELLEEEKKAGYGLRVFVSGGGCHGYQYGMAFEEKPAEEDMVIESAGVQVFLDPASAPILRGTVVDFVDSLQGSGFAIKNPQAKSTCGCGSSFNT